MKTKNIILIVFSIILLGACFKDEGNYTLLPDAAPVFDLPENAMVYCYEGDTTFFEGKFHFTTPDSLQRMEHLSYEWSITGKVVSREKDFAIPTDSVMRLLGLEKFPTTFLIGMYTVIDNTTGIRYLKSVGFYLLPLFGTGNWMILSKNGANACLSYQRLEKKNKGEKVDSVFHNYSDIYKERNNGEELAGTPRFLLDHKAPHISSYSGATLIVTDKEAYEINNENLMKAADLREEFLGGTPGDFSVKDAWYCDQYTLLAMESGNLYRREMSKNYLGGKFVSIPYWVDEKGAQVEFFANGQINTWVNLRLCFDRLNNRLLMINQNYTPMAAVMPLVQSGTGHQVTPWDMGPDKEILAVSEIGCENWTYGYYGACYCMLYNEGGKTYIAHFFVDSRPPSYYGKVVNNSYMRVEECPVFLTRDNIIRMTSTGRARSRGFEDYILYSSANEIRYIRRSTLRDGCLIRLNDKVTAYHFSLAANNHEQMGVGLANGDFVRVNVKNKEAAFVIESSRFNVGGEIVDVSDTGGRIYCEE